MQLLPWRRSLLACSTFTLIIASASAQTTSSYIRTVALLHSPLYTAADGETFASLGLPSIDDAGRAAFRTNLGVYSEGPGPGLDEIARLGGDAPTGGVFDGFIGLNVNDAGQAAVLARVSGPGPSPSRIGIWMENSAGGLSPVVQVGDPAPDAGPNVYFPDLVSDDVFVTGSGLPGFSVNAQGRVAFQSALIGPGAIDANDRAVYAGSLNDLSLVTRRGAAAAGAGGAVFSRFRGVASEAGGAPAPAMNDAGQLAFMADVEGPNVTSANATGIWIGSSQDSLTMAARMGEHAPGTEASARWSFLYDLTLNNAGQIAFVGYLSGPGIGASNDSGLWMGAPGALSLVARDGMPAPGAGSAVFRNLQGFYSPPPVLNARGEMAFVAELSGPGVNDSNDGGLWLRSASGEISLVAREGDPAPGGGVFHGFETFGSQFTMNSQGQIAFLAHAIFPDDPLLSKKGIWATDRQGQLQMVVATRQSLEFSNEPQFGSQTAPIGDLTFVGGADEAGFATGFNDRGELAFWAESLHGTHGLYVSTLVAIPEPAAHALVLGVVGAVAVVRRRFFG